MRNAALLPLIIIGAVVLGGLLYLYGGPSFHQAIPTSNVGATSPITLGGSANFSILAQGQEAPSVSSRVNYRVTSADQLGALWQMVYTDNEPVPSVDFSRYEILALFDGSHSTGGYGIQVASVKDTGGQRVVTIAHIEPGDSCVPPAGATSPFVMIQVPKSSLPISRVESTQTTQCE